MSADGTDTDGSSLWRSLADLVVYAPIGLTLDAQDLAPDLARRGRQHTAAARRIGEFAVKAGMRRLDEFVEAIDPVRGQSPTKAGDASPAEAPAAAELVTPAAAVPEAAIAIVTDEPQAAPEAPVVAEEQPSAGSAELAIPDYDLLAASQVVKRLDGLDPDQLDAIRRYEEAGRGRRTILHKITRLQSG